jgi:acetylornithine deacetylase/succinyl-diaminopimelate desuccinylase-like protein
MMEEFGEIDRKITMQVQENIKELTKLCAQPSVSATGQGLKECSEIVSSMLTRRGFEVTMLPTAGAPVVFAERKGKTDKTLLFYNHYDVQPPEPLELWETPPFEPTVRNGKLFARGATDDKGELMTRLAAIDALIEANGELPCNVKFCIEGEEESSSEHIRDCVLDNLGKFKSDACIWEFGEVLEDDQPMQYLGVRGIAYLELSVETASQDVHSGTGGSIFPNAAWRLVWALNSLKTQDERIAIPGFYDKVKPPSTRDIELMAKLPDSGPDYKSRFGIKKFLKGMEGGVELRLAEVFQPTCTICGLTSGYQGPGAKTVQPHVASAKIDFRLVPDQIAEEIPGLVRRYLDSLGFDDLKITDLGFEGPSRTDPDDPFVKLVVDTARQVYQKPMGIVPLAGGSGPNEVFQKNLRLPIVTAGCGYPGANSHSPNENLDLGLYEKCVKHLTRIMIKFGNG